MWQKELEELESRSLVKGQGITGMPSGKAIADPTFDMIAEQDKYKKVIEGLLIKLQIERRKVIEYIENIDDSMIRQIVFLRSVSCMTWNQVADEIGGNNSENSVRMLYNRFLNNN